MFNNNALKFKKNAIFIKITLFQDPISRKTGEKIKLYTVPKIFHANLAYD